MPKDSIAATLQCFKISDQTFTKVRHSSVATAIVYLAIYQLQLNKLSQNSPVEMQ